MRTRSLYSLGSDIYATSVLFQHWMRKCGHVSMSYGKIKRADRLLYVDKGKIEVLDTDIVCSAGDLLYIPRFSTTGLRYSDDCNEVMIINFILNDNNGEFQLNINPLIVAHGGNIYSSIFYDFVKNSQCTRIGKSLFERELLFKLLRVAAESNTESQCKAIQAGLDMLRKRFNENLPISEYAHASNMSVVYFRRLFRRYFEMTPVDYRNHIRLEKARELIYNGEFNVSEAALHVGFESVSYFNKLYKRYFGVSPGKYRNNM